MDAEDRRMRERKEATLRQAKAEKTRNHIFDTALLLFREKGFDETAIRDITERAGVSVGNFYHYFPSKQAILEEEFRRADDDFKVLMDSDCLGCEGTARIVTYMRHYGAQVATAGYDMAKQLYTYRNTLFLRKDKPMQTGLTALVADCQEKGLLAATPPPGEICRFFFVAARGAVLDWCVRGGEGDIVEELGSQAERLLHAFTP